MHAIPETDKQEPSTELSGRADCRTNQPNELHVDFLDTGRIGHNGSAARIECGAGSIASADKNEYGCIAEKLLTDLTKESAAYLAHDLGKYQATAAASCNKNGDLWCIKIQYSGFYALLQSKGMQT